MQWILWLFLLFSVFYLGVLILVIFAFTRLRKKPLRVERPFISVVVAAKNEQGRLEPLIQSLRALNYPEDLFEVILVDDASTDATYAILETAASEHSNWKVLRRTEASDRYHAKKMALAMAIDSAQGELIFTTDADCVVPANWLEIMGRYFDAQTQMVLGYSPLETTNRYWDALLKFDNLFSAIVSAAPTMLGFPISSVGRNMAFRKSAYRQIGGYASLTKFRSGDDIHLTERMRDKVKGEITFCAHPETFVRTQPPATRKEIYQQQIRKNSKILDKSFKSALFSVALLFTYLLFFTLPLFNPAWLWPWLGILAAKFILEFIALVYAVRIFKLPQLLKWLPLMQLIYPFYVMYFGLLGSLHLYNWK